MQGGGHFHIGIFEVHRLNERSFVALFVVGSDIIVDAPCVERVTRVERDGHGEW